MSQVIVDEALLREPNLWTPKRMPVGPVKIDWSHPLTRKLKLAWIATNRANLVDGAMPTADGSTFTPTGDGPARYFDGTRAGAIYWDKEYLLGSNGDGTGSYTIFAKCKALDTSAIYAIAGQKWDPSGGTYAQTMLGYNLNGALSLTANFATFWQYSTSGGIAATSTATWGVTDYHSFLGTNYSSGSKNYRDGVNKTTAPYLARDIADGTRKTLIGHGGKTTDADSFKGWIDTVYMFDRSLEAGEQSSLHRDPYQFLMPA